MNHHVYQWNPNPSYTFCSREISMSSVKYQFRKVTVFPNFFLGAAHFGLEPEGSTRLRLPPLVDARTWHLIFHHKIHNELTNQVRESMLATQLFNLNLPNSRGKKRPLRPVWDSWIAVISFRDNLSVQHYSSQVIHENKRTRLVHCSDREYGMSPNIKMCCKHCQNCYFMTISTLKFPTNFFKMADICSCFIIYSHIMAHCCAR